MFLEPLAFKARADSAAKMRERFFAGWGKERK